MTAISKLQVVVKTANVSKAGTSDTVWLDVGKMRWKLDNPGWNDFEQGHEDSFDLPPGSALQDTDLWRVLICKGPDGQYGGWKLDGIKLLVNGSVMYQRQGIAKWLENEGTREWIASDFTSPGAAPKSIVLSEATVKTKLQGIVNQLSTSKLKPLGSLSVAVDCADIFVKQKFEADVTGPNPDITMSVRFVPVVRDGKIEVVVSNMSVDVDFPWWFEAATGIIVAELIEQHIEGELKTKLKAEIKSVLQTQISQAIPTGIAKQVCLRPNKVEVFV